MARNNKKAQEEHARKGLLRKGYAPSLVDAFIKHQNDPMVATAFTDRNGMYIGYIDPARGRVEDRSGELHEIITAKNAEAPKLYHQCTHNLNHFCAEHC